MSEKLRTVRGPCCLCLVIGLALGLLLPGLFEKTASLTPAVYGDLPQPGPELRLDLNSATAAQLQELPGIGPSLADRILEYREKNGPFRTPWELTAVSGLGEATVANLLAYVTVSEKEK